MSPSTDNERLSILPAWLVMHAELAADDLGLLTLIALHADRNGSCFPSQGTLASQLKRSRTWVCRRVAFLVSVGIGILSGIVPAIRKTFPFPALCIGVIEAGIDAPSRALSRPSFST